jgi:hypothetical protein
LEKHRGSTKNIVRQNKREDSEMRIQSGWKKRRRFIFFLFFELLLTLFLSEMVSRFFWNIKYKVPFFQMDKIIYAFYPELKIFQNRVISSDNKTFDILLLGGSVLNKKWSDIERLLLEKLTYITKKKITIYNVARPSHTSLDSYYKYKYLDDKQFDLVIFYHGINEIRANNVPPSLFKRDYSHYSWYKYIVVFESYRPIIKYISLPYTVNYIVITLSNRLGISSNVHTRNPKQSWLKYGSSIKTVDSFKENLNRIIEIASLKGEPLLLMTFAYYLPENYDYDKFKAKSLDYTLHLSEIEIWGTPENVIAGLAAHNLVIQQISSHHKNVYFIDQYNLIPKNGEYFNDVCHLTYKGAEAFVNNILNLIKDLMNSLD